MLRAGKDDEAVSLQEELLAPIAVFSEVYPSGVPGYLNVNGDALITFDPRALGEFIASHPDIPEGTVVLLRQVPAEEAPNWGVAAVDNDGRIIRFAEKPTKGYEGAEEGRREILKREGLLVGDKYVLMNTAFMILGGEAIVRWLKLAGVKVDGEGNFEIKGRHWVVEEELSVWDRLMKYGGELDTFGHLVAGMAQEIDANKFIFGEVFKKYEAGDRLHNLARRLAGQYIENGQVKAGLVQAIDAEGRQLEAEYEINRGLIST